ncbi:MAG: hypothetical protein EBZ69_01505 [Alphaproteobacteria bacterium]|nr:hypothetical protein [Alphaproteobacteria bacterium]
MIATRSLRGYKRSVQRRHPEKRITSERVILAVPKVLTGFLPVLLALYEGTCRELLDDVATVLPLLHESERALVQQWMQKRNGESI